ncbi:MAG TPA: hypothetical protein VMB71_02015 [Acetobacteraceae bacterium]|nr:hypothetical protein [Acetobacteraceae bacterium]
MYASRIAEQESISFERRCAARMKIECPTKERKYFFFEKKKQKTFAHGPAPSGYMVGIGAAATGKSFLVLFFKKEHFYLTP